jgi:sirohydrochlorin ferrochelatase
MVESRQWLTLLSNGIASASHLSPARHRPVKSPDLPTCFLFDNGSLRAASTLNLREVARALEKQIGAHVEAVSLLHSSGVDAAELDGRRAQLLEPALQTWFGAKPKGAVVALPFFFGPSAALTAYVPERLGSLRSKFPEARVEQAGWLVDPALPDDRVALALAEAVRAIIRRENLSRANVVVVDHGSPQRGVAAVRDFLTEQVGSLLAKEVGAVGAASMESRAGEEYAFNQPLLADRLRTTPFDAGNVVIALQFLSPGRHAGARGDVAEICARAESERLELRTWMSETIGTDPRVIDVLAERYRQAAAKLTAETETPK